MFLQSGVQSINIPSTLKEITRCTFYECENLRNVGFSEGLEKIGNGAFYETVVESITFPGSLRTIGQGAFCKCGHLKTVKFGEGLEVLGTNEHLHGEGM